MIKCVINNRPSSRLTLEAGPQVPAPQHPRVEAERVPVLRAEEALRGDLQRVQRQPAGALRVRPGLLQHHVRPGREQSPPAAALEAGAEHPGGGRRVQGLGEPERGGPDGLVPGAAVRLLPDQGLDGEALLVAAVLEHREHLRCADQGNGAGLSGSRSADSDSKSPHNSSRESTAAQKILRGVHLGVGSSHLSGQCFCPHAWK